MPRISQLPALTVPEASDEIAIVDASAATTKKITRADFLKGAALPADTVDTQSIADGAVTSPKIDWPTYIDWSASMVLTGWSSTAAKNFNYLRMGNIVFFYAQVEGTSNSTTSTMSLPVPVVSTNTSTALVLNNGAWSPGSAVINSSNNTVSFLTGSLGNLSATGAKGFRINGFYFV